MDRYRLAVVIEDDDLEQPPGAVRSDVEVPITFGRARGAGCGPRAYVRVRDAMPSGGVRDLHRGRSTCAPSGTQDEGLAHDDANQLGAVEWPSVTIPQAALALLVSAGAVRLVRGAR